MEIHNLIWISTFNLKFCINLFSLFAFGLHRPFQSLGGKRTRPATRHNHKLSCAKLTKRQFITFFNGTALRNVQKTTLNYMYLHKTYLAQINTVLPYIKKILLKMNSMIISTLLCEVSINSIGKSFFFSTHIVYNFYMQKLYCVKLL